MEMRSLVVALLLTIPVALAIAPAAEAGASIRLVAFGDTSVTPTAQRIVDASVADGAVTYLGLGDYNYDYSVSAWKTMFSPLKTKYLAIGNHDDRTLLAEFFPQGTRWSQSVNGARIVALNGNEPVDTTRLRSDLCNAPEQVRIVISHQNWWLGAAAHHPGSEFPASASTMDTILKDCGVDLVLAGHEHNYQRMMRNDIPYVIVGTGGRGLYPLAGVPSGTVATYAGYGRLVVDLADTGFSAQFKALDGSVKDSFTKGATAPAPTPAPAPSPAPTGTVFTPKTGNEWWVQVAVSGAPTSVFARDTGGAWVALAKKSWGDWAASFHVEPGHQVQYQANYAGALVESCWYAGTVCASAGTTPAPTPAPAPSNTTSSFTATWKNVRGNAWWVETDVTVAGGTLAKVDARVNGGAWVALDHRSYGSWAKSIAAPSGSRVEFRAVSTTGSTAISGTYAWPPG